MSFSNFEKIDIFSLQCIFLGSPRTVNQPKINLRAKSKTRKGSEADEEGGPDGDDHDDEPDASSSGEDEPLRPQAPVSYHFVSHSYSLSLASCPLQMGWS